MIRIKTVGITVALLVALAATGCGQPVASPAAETSPEAILEGSMVTAQVGWVIAVPNGLAVTHDGGSQWNLAVDSSRRKIAPVSAYFRSSTDGWLLEEGPVTGAGRQITVMRTIDGGMNWVPAIPFTLTPSEDVGAGSVRFTDALHGWVLLAAITSPNFSLAYLFRTTDGGQTWAMVRAPFDGRMSFANTLTGWILGGLSGGELAVTHDGGSTWAAEDIGVPHGPPLAGTSALLRVIGSKAVFARSTRNEGSNTIDTDFFVTQAPDFRWTHVARITRALGGVAYALIDTAQWVVAFDDRLTVTRDAGHVWTDTGRVPQGGSLTTFDFATVDIGLVVLQSVSCASFKSNCSRRAQLLRTQDSGQTWLPTSLPN
jgi:photosystem II stability/assembly factor-like uncharacterized protein